MAAVPQQIGSFRCWKLARSGAYFSGFRYTERRLVIDVRKILT
jgi:hypothetical protein